MVDEVIQQNVLDTFVSGLSDEVINRSEGDLLSQEMISQYVAQMMQQTEADLQRYLDFAANYEGDRSSLQAEVANIRTNLLAMYQGLQTVLDNFTVSNDTRYNDLVADVATYLQILSDVKLDSSNITLDNGDLRYGAWTILSQARQWDLDIINRLNSLEVNNAALVETSMDEVKNLIRSDEETISLVIGELSNSPIIQALDAKLNNNLAGVDTLFTRMNTEIAAQAQAIIDSAAQVKAEAMASIIVLESTILEETDVRTQELSILAGHINEGLALETQERLADIALLNDGLTAEINLLKDADTATLTALNNYKTSNDNALANIQQSLDANVTATTANASSITALDTRLTTNETNTASAISKADTALTENTAQASQINAINAALESKADVTALNTLQAEVTTIDGKVAANTNSLTSLSGRVTNVEDDLTTKADATALNNYYTKTQADSATAGQISSFNAGLVIGGVNQVINSEAERTSTAPSNKEYLMYERSEHLRQFYEDNLGKTITISFEILVPVAGTVTVYASNASAHTFWSSTPSLAANTWTKVVLNVTPVRHTNFDTTTVSTLEFYGTYTTGRIPTVRKVQVEAGTKATAWALSPRDTKASLDANATAISGLTTRVTNAEGSITSQSTSITNLQNSLNTLSGTVDTKASTSALNALDSTVTTLNGKVTTNTNSITSLSGRMTTVESGLTTKADASALNNYYTKSESDYKATTIAAGEVSKYDANLVIGGANLLTDTKTFNKAGTLELSKTTLRPNYVGFGSAFVTDPDSMLWRTHTVVEVRKDWCGFYYSCNSDNPNDWFADQDMTFSVWVKNSTNADIYAYGIVPALGHVATIPNGEWQRIVMRIEKGRALRNAGNQGIIEFHFTATEGAFYYAAPMLQYGNAVTSWQPSQEEVQNALDANALAIQSTNADVSRIDGVVTSQASSISSLQSSLSDVDTKANTAINNAAAAQQTANTAVTASESNANSINNLTSSVGLLQGSITEVRQTVTNNQESTNTLVTSLRSGMVDADDINMLMRNATVLFEDLNFSNGNNGLSVYNNLYNGTIASSFTDKQPDNPVAATRQIKFVHTGAADPELGGFYRATYSRPNGVFVIKFVAKLPVGYTFNLYANLIGDDASSYFIGSSEGTGKYKTYYGVYRCGATGAFSTLGFVAVKGPQPTPENPLVWYLASSTVYDCLDSKVAPDSVINGIAEAKSTANTAVTQAEATAVLAQNLQASLDSTNANISTNYITKAEADNVVAAKVEKFSSSTLSSNENLFKGDLTTIPKSSAPGISMFNWDGSVVFDCSAGNGNWVFLYLGISPYTINNNGQYGGPVTVSMDYYIDPNANGALPSFYFGHGYQVFESTSTEPLTPQKWVRIFTTFYTDANFLLSNPHLGLGAVVGRVLIRNLKVERGNLTSYSADIKEATQTINGIQAIRTVTIDNNGVMSGYGLVSELKDGQVTSGFGINADQFYIGAPAGGKKPFIVTTTTTTINGVSYPAGTWIDTAFIANATIGGAKIQNASIDTAQITDGAITNAKIENLAVTGAKIANATIGTAQIADLAVTGAKIANATIGSAQIADAAITSAKIGDAQITSAKIASLSVNSLNIANNAVTVASAHEITTAVNYLNTTTLDTVHTLTVNVSGTNFVKLDVYPFLQVNRIDTATNPQFYIEFYRDTTLVKSILLPRTEDADTRSYWSVEGAEYVQNYAVTNILLLNGNVFSVLDNPAAGTYTYTVKVKRVNNWYQYTTAANKYLKLQRSLFVITEVKK